MLCRKLYQLIDIVRLYFCLMGSFVALYLSAFCTAVNNDISLFWVCNTADRLHRCAAFVGTVAGIDINVQRPETHGTVVTGGISQRLYFSPAMSTDKAVIIF